YVVEIFIAPVDWRAVAVHSVLPQIADAGALLLAVGIIGATVMPHAVYLHSGLTQARTPGRDEAERQKLVRISNHEVVIALAVASLVVLSIALPLPMIALLLFTGRADIMGRFANGRPTAVAALVGTALVLLLNAILILQTFGVPIPGLAAG